MDRNWPWHHLLSYHFWNWIDLLTQIKEIYQIRPQIILFPLFVPCGASWGPRFLVWAQWHSDWWRKFRAISLGERPWTTVQVSCQQHISRFLCSQHASRWAKTRNSLCHLFGQNQSKINLTKKTIKLEQLGLRRGLWGHSFKSSYSLELIIDFWKK